MIFDKYCKANLAMMIPAVVIFSLIILEIIPGEFRYVGWTFVALQLIVFIVQVTSGTMKRDLPTEFWIWFKEGLIWFKEGLKKRPIFTGDIPDG